MAQNIKKKSSTIPYCTHISLIVNYFVCPSSHLECQSHMSCDHHADDSWDSSICTMCTRPSFVFSCSLSHCQAISMTFWPRCVHRHHAWGRSDCRDCGRLLPGLLPPPALWRFAAAALDGPVRDAAVLVSLLPHHLHPATWCQHGIQTT